LRAPFSAVHSLTGNLLKVTNPCVKEETVIRTALKPDFKAGGNSSLVKCNL